MSVLAWIVAASILGGFLSVACAGLFAISARSAWVPWLISYAIGALLGAAFLEIVPHALEAGQSPQQLTGWLLFGILLFFLLEKLVLWRHYHGENGVHARADAEGRERSHEHDHGRSGLMILIGDSFHNFVDGIIIAGAFVAEVRLGVVTAIAIIAHEIPQEVGDFLILLHSGYTKRQAFIYNLIASGATLVGGILAWAALRSMRELVPPLLGIAAASMIYVAVADLIPGLHKRTELRATALQVTLIALGIGSIWVIHALIEHPG